MMELFAQVSRRPQPTSKPPDVESAMAIGSIFLIIIIVFMVSQIIYAVIFIMTLVKQSKLLASCSKNVREMEPGMVWLSFIPAFGFVWYILVIIRTADSARKQFRKLKAKPPIPDCGKQSGIMAFILYVFLSFIPFLPAVIAYGYLKKINLVTQSLQKAIRQAKKAKRQAEEDEDDEDEDDD